MTELAADGGECCDVARGVAIWLTSALDDDACRGQDAPDDVSHLSCGENRIFGSCTGCCVSLGGLPQREAKPAVKQVNGDTALWQAHTFVLRGLFLM